MRMRRSGGRCTSPRLTGGGWSWSPGSNTCLSRQPLGLCVERAALFADPLLHVLLLVVATLFVAVRFGPFCAALFSVGLAAIFPLAAAFLPGVADDFGLVQVCSLWSVLLLVAGTTAGKRATVWYFAAGVAGGCGLWLSAMVPGADHRGDRRGRHSCGTCGARRRCGARGRAFASSTLEGLGLRRGCLEPARIPHRVLSLRTWICSCGSTIPFTGWRGWVLASCFGVSRPGCVAIGRAAA